MPKLRGFHLVLGDGLVIAYINHPTERAASELNSGVYCIDSCLTFGGVSGTNPASKIMRAQAGFSAAFSGWWTESTADGNLLLPGLMEFLDGTQAPAASANSSDWELCAGIGPPCRGCSEINVARHVCSRIDAPAAAVDNLWFTQVRLAIAIDSQCKLSMTENFYSCSTDTWRASSYCFRVGAAEEVPATPTASLPQSSNPEIPPYIHPGQAFMGGMHGPGAADMHGAAPGGVYPNSLYYAFIAAMERQQQQQLMYGGGGGGDAAFNPEMLMSQRGGVWPAGLAANPPGPSHLSTPAPVMTPMSRATSGAWYDRPGAPVPDPLLAGSEAVLEVFRGGPRKNSAYVDGAHAGTAEEAELARLAEDGTRPSIAASPGVVKEAMPKGFVTAFNIFSKEKRAECIKILADMEIEAERQGRPIPKTANSVNSMLGKLWHSLPPRDRHRYYLVAEADKMRYAKEMETYNPSFESVEPRLKAKMEIASKKRKRGFALRLRKHPDAPRRPRSAYMCFLKATRPEFRAKNPDVGFADVGHRLGQMWRELDPERKAIFAAESAADKERYAVEKAEYGAKNSSPWMTRESIPGAASHAGEEEEEDLEEADDAEATDALAPIPARPAKRLGGSTAPPSADILATSAPATGLTSDP